MSRHPIETTAPRKASSVLGWLVVALGFGLVGVAFFTFDRGRLPIAAAVVLAVVALVCFYAGWAIGGKLKASAFAEGRKPATSVQHLRTVAAVGMATVVMPTLLALVNMLFLGALFWWVSRPH